jgi:MFS family permease
MAASFQPSDTLRSRTFVGLLIAQFLAAFNDQAIHAAAMFFAINTQSLSEAQAISLMPILFYAPWALFCTLAGYLADKYSKYNSLVAWKLAEVAITALALLGFWLGTHDSRSGPWIVLSTVFLMGTHSAFFVPAKYGVMPEILTGRMLSRGNGLLESLSFLAVILGTVCGGVLSTRFRGQEWIIGLILVGLAFIGAVASLLMRRMPAANPGRAFPSYLYGPLVKNVRALLSSRPLAFAVVGIAFFTFVVAFMRATVYMFGESQVPRWTEQETSMLVGLVALGIGVGSPLVGYLSAGKVETGLVPLGAAGMITATVVAAFCLGHTYALGACIVLIGFFTGFYIVPLFTLLQHRAPKTSKGDMIATSNLINVTGAIAASLVFYGMDRAAGWLKIAPKVDQTDKRPAVLAEDPEYEHGRPVRMVLQRPRWWRPAVPVDWSALRNPLTRVVARRDHVPEGRRAAHEVDLDVGLIDAFRDPLQKGDVVIESTYKITGVPGVGEVHYHRFRREGEPQRPAYDKRGVPELLFLSAGAMTLLTLLLLWRQMPDLFLRTRLWLRSAGRYRLEVAGLHHLPASGPAVLAVAADRLEPCLQALAATDRTARFLILRRPDERAGWLVRTVGARRGLGVVDTDGKGVDWSEVRARALAALELGEVVGLPLTEGPAGAAVDRLLDELAATGAPVVPAATRPGRRRAVFLEVGAALPADAGAAAAREETRTLVLNHVDMDLNDAGRHFEAADRPAPAGEQIQDAGRIAER